MPYKNKEDKKKYHRRQDVRDRKNKARREKYANDPEYRKKVLGLLKKGEYAKKWSKNNPEKMRAFVKKYRDKNKEKIKKHRQIYIKENREKIRKSKKKWSAYMRKTNIKFNLNGRISNAIRHSLKGNRKGNHWETLVGYTINDLIKRLKKTIPEGYIWEDYMKGKFHIDHIIPVSAFNFANPEHTDFQNCWALKNLRLLPVKENLLKGNKLKKPFQPALRINRNCMAVRDKREKIEQEEMF